MPATLKRTLSDLISRNRYKEFFAAWEAEIDPDTLLNVTRHQLAADYYELQENEITHLLREEEAQRRRRQLTSGLLALTSKITSADLRQSSLASPPQTTQDDQIKNLMRKKLAALQRARILATDAGVKFKLDVEIKELKDGLG